MLQGATIITGVAFALSGCSVPEWRGLHVGPSVVHPISDPEPSEDDLGLEVNAIWGLPTGASLQTQAIIPMTDPGEPLYRLALSWRIW